MGYRHLRNKKEYKKIYDDLIKNRKVSTAEIKKIKADDLSDISPAIVASILEKLKKFEADIKFRDHNLTQAKLASRLHSNTAYISRIVFYHSGEKFTDYINNLRVNYIMQLLDTESRYRNYTNKALAEEAGFNSTKQFVNAFKKKNKIAPSYYIAQQKKEATAR